MSVVLLFLMPLALGVAASPGELVVEAEYFSEVTTEVETPHTKWAKPYYRGSLRVLFIAPRPCMRDAVELWQRFDIDFEAVPTYMRKSLGGAGPVYTRIPGLTPEDVKERLLRALRKRWDVIVVGNIRWDILPVEAEYEILRQVHDGAGLVLTYYTEGQTEHLRRLLKMPPADDKGFITEGIPWNGLRPWWGEGPEEAERKARRGWLRLLKFKAGRVVALNYGRRSANTFLIPEVGPEFVDYYMAFVAKAILWAAGREPELRLVKLTALDEKGRPSTSVGLKGARVEVGVESSRFLPDLSIEVWVRDFEGREVWRRALPLSLDNGGKGRATVALPRLVGGKYFAEVIVKSRGRCVNFGSVYFEAVPPVGLKEVSLDKPFIEPGGAVAVKASLSGPAPEGASLRFRLLDNLGRLLDERIFPLRKGAVEAASTLSSEGVLTNLARIKCSLFVKGEEWHRMEVLLPVDNPVPKDRFGFLVWGGARTVYCWRFVNKILFDLGVDTSNIGGAAVLALDNLRALPYITRIYARKVEDEGRPVRVPCLTDPKYIESERRKLTRRARKAAPYGTTGYTLGDENYLALSRDVCFSPTCLKEFREHLRKLYGSLDALNREWGTDFRSWEEVEPLTLPEARRKGLYPPWADHRMFMEEVFARTHALFARFIRQEDPDARVGFDGAFSTDSWHGYDWWKLSRILDVWNVYPRPFQVELVRSLKRPGTYCGFWFGGYIRPSPGQRYEAFERWAPWYSLLHGMNSVWWFKIYSHADERCQEDGVAADLRVMPSLKWTAEEVRRIRTGFDKLLLGSLREDLGIAVLYSQPSVHASTLDPKGGSHVASCSALIGLLEDLGLQFDMVAYAQLAEGEVSRRGYKVLLLPGVRALSSREREEIKGFIERGGLLVADLRPGIMDSHCKPVPYTAWWEGVFGVSYEPSAGVREKTEAVVKGRVGEVRLSLRLEGVAVDRGIRPKGAVALGSAQEAPVVLMNRKGRGWAVLLNMSFASYRTDEPVGRAWREVLGALLNLVGIRPPARIVKASPGEVFHGEVVFYRDGPYRYVALLRDPSPPEEIQEVSLALPRRNDGTPYFVYLPLEGRALGRIDKVSLSLGPGRVALLSLLPQPLVAVKVRPLYGGEGAFLPGGEAKFEFALKTEDGKEPPGRHILFVKVIGPGGRVLRHYCRSVEAPSGRGLFRFRLARNDPPGEWGLEVRDAATGVKGSVKFSVKPRG